MTCIVGIIDKKEIVMGADSAGVAGLKITTRKDPKVFKNGNFLIGCTSSFRMINLLRFSLNPPEQLSSQDDYEYMCTSFIDSVRDCFKRGGYTYVNNNQENGGTFLVGYNRRIYCIESDFQVAESLNDYTSIGCGEEFAIGSLATTQGQPMSSEERVKIALKISSENSGGVAPPFIIETI